MIVLPRRSRSRTIARVRSHLTIAEEIGVIRTCDIVPERTENVISHDSPLLSYTDTLYTPVFLVIVVRIVSVVGLNLEFEYTIFQLTSSIIRIAIKFV